MKRTIRVAVVGATGYAGAELVRLFQSHPNAEVTTVTSARSAGKKLSEECPWIASSLQLETFHPGIISEDFTFLCQEAGFAMEHAPELIKRTRVIDLSADFRLKDPLLYEQYYNRPFSAEGTQGVYGLPELVDRKEIANAKLLANPGCYPTGTLLGLMPLVRAGLVTGTPVIDAKSGVSGAGRSKKDTEYLFSELSGGFKAYAVSGHRHTPEIEQLAGVPIRFTPHLIPTPRGLEVTLHVTVSSGENLTKLYEEFYKNEPFVNVVQAQPSIKQVVGSNRCDICPSYDEHTGYAVITTVIDNLVKGAAGQAIQNMNLMAGLTETTGLPISGLWP
ncbi:MAG: N-acetyl-gamma-glutamyl-phosphate reductase [Fimbriimonas sp.]